MSPYSQHSTGSLLQAVSAAPRVPPPDLISACLQRFRDLVPGLLSILDAHSPGKAGWSGHVLAGLLLIEGKVRKAIPVFEAVYRDAEREPALSPWFDHQLANLGPGIVPPFRKLALDSAAWPSGRLAAIDVLSNVARLFPADRDRVLATLRGVIGNFSSHEYLDSNDLELLAWSISALIDLGDRDSLPVVRSLAQNKFFDEETIEDFEEYVQLLDEAVPSPDVVRPMPVRDLYAAVRNWDAMTPEQVVQHYQRAMKEAGIDERFVTSLMSIALARYVGVGAEVSGEHELLASLRETLSRAGVPAPHVDHAVKELLISVLTHNGIETETILPVGIGKSVRVRMLLDKDEVS